MNALDNFFSGLRTSATGLSAERIRMNVIAENIAGANITRTPEGGPYTRKQVVFEPLVHDDGDVRGVRASSIVPDTVSEFVRVHDPGHEHADGDGYVTLPNVNSLKEMADLITAMRAYEANLNAQRSFSQMATRALELARPS